MRAIGKTAGSVPTMSTPYFVYVIQSQEPRPKRRPGFFYVGMTTDPARRLREHNGEIKGGGRYTSKHRPWIARALFGPYPTRSDALRAEYKLKHTKRGEGRLRWTPEDSPLCCGEGVNHPWVKDPVGWRPSGPGLANHSEPTPDGEPPGREGLGVPSCAEGAGSQLQNKGSDD